MVLDVETAPTGDERRAARSGRLAGGGPAATAAVAISRLGVPVAFVGRVGPDAAGRLIRDGLAEEGVNTDLLSIDPRIDSALSACLVQPDGNRALAAFGGARPTTWPMTPAIAELCRAATWVHVDHVGWTMAAQLVGQGIRTPISVDGGNPIPGLDLARISLYVPSRKELCRWTGREAAADALLDAFVAGSPIVVATDGAAGSAGVSALPLATAGLAAALQAATISHTRSSAHSIVQAAYPAAGSSTLGAGDVFHGAILAALVNGQTLPAAMAFASAAAAISCRGLDGRSGIPTWMEVEMVVGTADQLSTSL